MTQFSNIIRLSFRDYSHEWRMSGCFILALASVLAPMMILFGLKFGIVTTMIHELVENPANREIKPIGSGQYDDAWLESMRQRGDVEFIIPRTRALAATIQLKSSSAKRIVSTELLATAPGDPLLVDATRQPQNYFQVILSHAAAKKLNVKPGAEIDASLARQFQGKRERVHLPLEVIDVAAAGVISRNVAFVDLELLIASEQFKDGRAVEALGWSGNSGGLEGRTYPSFRLYAHSIYDVEQLVSELEKEGTRVKANVAEISTVQSIDQNLSVIFWIIACVGAIGFAFSLLHRRARLAARGPGISRLRVPHQRFSGAADQSRSRTLFPAYRAFPVGVGADRRNRYFGSRPRWYARRTDPAFGRFARSLNFVGLVLQKRSPQPTSTVAMTNRFRCRVDL